MQIHRLSRRSLVVILFFMAVLALLVNGTFWLGQDYLAEIITLLADPQTKAPHVRPYLPKIVAMHAILKPYVVPVLSLIFLGLGFVLWLFWRVAAFGPLRQPVESAPEPKKTDGQAFTGSSKKEQHRRDRRLFLYLLSVLQREGRLVDFLFENLDGYQDEQIGAAVRSIHAGCNKVMAKNLALKPIMVAAEGDEIVIEKGFNADQVKLTGNVIGDPPFKGIVRHRGWQAKKLELPALSNFRQSDVIAPAEVEIRHAHSE
jgi:hypothetical protein